MERGRVMRKKRRHPGLTALMTLIVLAGIAALLVSRTLFVVRTIQVEGISAVTAQEVIVQSKLRQGESIFTIDQQRLEENINAHKMLYFESMDIKFPSTVIIHVREREACAQIEHLGFMYAIDETGRVLDKSADLDAEQTLPVIKGASIVSIVDGEKVRLIEESQLENAQRMLSALKEANLLMVTDELNVSDRENLYIMTREGCKVEIGNTLNMNVKFAIAQAIIRDQGDKSLLGVRIDVSSGRDGYFIPPDM